MTNITYDADADAVYITVGRGKVDRPKSGPFIYDVDAEGHIVGIQILSASKVLAPGDWKKAGAPDDARVNAAAYRSSRRKRLAKARAAAGAVLGAGFARSQGARGNPPRGRGDGAPSGRRNH